MVSSRFRIFILRGECLLPAAEHPACGCAAAASPAVLQAEIFPIESPHGVGAGASVLPVGHKEAGIYETAISDKNFE